LDLFIFHQINQFVFKQLWLDTLAIFFAQYLGHILIFCLFLFLLKNLKKYWPMIIQAFLSAILARFLIVEIIRYFLPRPRPFLEIPVNLLFEPLNQSSFPSGHAAFYFALSAVIFLYNKKAGLLFFLASFLIVISRVFVGIHWPSDILVGAAIGIFSGWIAILFLRKFSLIVKKRAPQ
jgi:undecaprenyl-diphosphatase